MMRLFSFVLMTLNQSGTPYTRMSSKHKEQQDFRISVLVYVMWMAPNIKGN